jgi:hypothetical protein
VIRQKITGREMKKFFKYTAVAALLLLLGIWTTLHLTRFEDSDFPNLKEGDIIFQTSNTSQTLAILFASKSLYSHMGILKRLKNGDFVVVEAAGPVRETPLKNWIERGIFGRITIKRFQNASDTDRQKVLHAARTYYGRPYDPFFLMETSRLYCSQLVYLAFEQGVGKRVGTLQTFKDLSLDNWAVRRLMESRWERHPLCQKGVQNAQQCLEIILPHSIITPVSIANDQRLETIYSNYLF